MVENSVDSTTGMVTVRGIMNNERETLWPGIWLRPSSSSAPRIRWWCRRWRCSAAGTAATCSWSRDGVARVQPVKVDRTFQGTSVIAELSGDENVVVDGQLLLSDGSRVEPRARKTGA